MLKNMDGEPGEGSELAPADPLAEARLADLRRDNAVAHQVGLEAAAEDLDLGELGHRRILVCGDA